MQGQSHFIAEYADLHYYCTLEQLAECLAKETKLAVEVKVQKSCNLYAYSL